MTHRAASPNASWRHHRRTSAKVASRPRDTGPYNKESSNSFLESNPAIVSEVEVETAALRAAKTRHLSRFLKGPIPLRDVAAASRLPGRALAVFLAINHRQALTRNSVVTLPRNLLADLGVTKDAKARALRALEAAGLVRVERQPGQSPRIRLAT
jgi:DNA-binding MarR family transcriptional regulator